MLIPCHWEYVKFLDSLIMNINQQLSSPDEIIIALSGVPEGFEKILKPFSEIPVHIYTDHDSRSAGYNRNKCVSKATGDILIFTDADDLMRSDRVLLLRHYFQVYDPIAIATRCYVGNNSIRMGEVILGRTVYANRRKPRVIQGAHWGSVACKREAFDNVEYMDYDLIYKMGGRAAEDVEFGRDLVECYGDSDRNVMFLDLPLTKYFYRGSRNYRDFSY